MKHTQSKKRSSPLLFLLFSFKWINQSLPWYSPLFSCQRTPLEMGKSREQQPSLGHPCSSPIPQAKATDFLLPLPLKIKQKKMKNEGAAETAPCSHVSLQIPLPFSVSMVNSPNFIDHKPRSPLQIVTPLYSHYNTIKQLNTIRFNMIASILLKSKILYTNKI